MSTKLGIIAGGGELPKNLAIYAEEIGRDYFVLGIEGEVAPDLKTDIALPISKVGQIIKALKEAEVKQIVIAGKISRPDFGSLKPDFEGIKLLPKILMLKDKGDDAILSLIVKYIEDKGFEVIGAHELLKDFLAPRGVLGRIAPDEDDMKNIEIGKKAALTLGSLDIGQAVIVQAGHVLGVEAAEGTDNLISRCHILHKPGRGGILVKMKKPEQEKRVDLPSIGIRTIENAKNFGLRGIAIEAGSAFIIKREEVIKKANDLGIFVIGIDG